MNPNNNQSGPKVAVIGAGWAGLAAASELVHKGCQVSLYESSRTAGGRARQVQDPSLGLIDNGQHLLLGAYQHTLRLIARDVPPESPQAHSQLAFTRLPLRLCSNDGQFQMGTPPYGPLWLKQALTLWLAKGLTLQDKWLATKLLRQLKLTRGVDGQEQTVSQWLRSHQQSKRLVDYLWEPLCLATLNTDLDQASAWLFQRVIFDALLSKEAHATDLLIPAVDLSSLWPNHVCQKVTTHFGHTVRHVSSTSQGVRIDQTEYDGCVIAIPAYGVSRLFEQAQRSQHIDLFEALERFEYRSITTCYVDLNEPLTLEEPLFMMRHTRGQTLASAPGQWVFDRNRCQPQSATTNGRLAFVISDSQSVLSLPSEVLAQTLMSQLVNERGSPSAPSSIKASRCIHEKRATFAALPHQSRPSNTTPWSGIVFAGDWTDTGYPSVLEGAIRSGLQATDCLLQQLQLMSLTTQQVTDR